MANVESNLNGKAPTEAPLAKASEKSVGKPSGKPTPVQMRYLRLGLDQPGGKLPLFDLEGQEIKPATIRSCIEKGWAEPWFDNPTMPNWIVCKLTEMGRKISKQT